MTEIQKKIKELQKEAFYIGEEGDIACFAKTKLGAWRKFRARVRKDCGEGWTLDEMEKSNICIGWFRLPTKEDKEEWGDDCDYIVSYREKSPYEVWVYRI
jgi:hypothetical protein